MTEPNKENAKKLAGILRNMALAIGEAEEAIQGAATWDVMHAEQEAARKILRSGSEFSLAALTIANRLDRVP